MSRRKRTFAPLAAAAVALVVLLAACAGDQTSTAAKSPQQPAQPAAAAAAAAAADPVAPKAAEVTGAFTFEPATTAKPKPAAVPKAEGAGMEEMPSKISDRRGQDRVLQLR